MFEKAYGAWDVCVGCRSAYGDKNMYSIVRASWLNHSFAKAGLDFSLEKSGDVQQ